MRVLGGERVQHAGREHLAARALLVSHALELLDHTHPEELSVREVARRAGVSSGAPNHHFPTKINLLAACAVVAWRELCEQLENDGSGEPEHRLVARAGAYLRFARAQPGPHQLIMSRLLDDVARSDEIAALRARAMNGIVDLIMAAGEPDLDHAAAKLRGVALWALVHGHVALDIGRGTGATETADAVVADLAARMALLPPLGQ